MNFFFLVVETEPREASHILGSWLISWSSGHNNRHPQLTGEVDFGSQFGEDPVHGRLATRWDSAVQGAGGGGLLTAWRTGSRGS